MGFTPSKDLDCHEEGRKKMGFCRSKDMDCYEKSWVSHKVKI